MSSGAESKGLGGNPLDPAKVLQVTNKKETAEVVKVNAFALGITRIVDLHCFSNLSVLSLSSNLVNDISGLRFCFSLTELYLRKNNVSDLRQIGYLQNLNNLNVLFLADNPCSQDELYRKKVLRCLKLLSTLDVNVVSDDDKSEVLNTTDQTILSFEDSVKRFLEENSSPIESEAKDIGTTVFKALQSDTFEDEMFASSGQLPPLTAVRETSSRPDSSRSVTRNQKGNVLEAIKLLMGELQQDEILSLRQMCDDILESNSTPRVSTAATTVRK